MDWNVSDIQCYWNKIEEIIIRIVDKLAPITKYVDNVTSKSKTPLLIKRKLSQRKRLLRRLKQNPSEDLKIRMKNLNAEIKSHYIISNRLTVLNAELDLNWLNLSLIAFKLKIKEQFLMN